MTVSVPDTAGFFAQACSEFTSRFGATPEFPEGFDRLTPSRQLDVLNCPDNFTGLSAAANASKRNLPYTEWHMHKGSGLMNNPLTPQPEDALRDAWPTVPASIRVLYSVHDGFFYFPSGACFSPQRWVTHLADEDWSIIEDLDQPPQLNLNTSFGFFNNGGGGYLCVDVDDCADDHAALWWATDPPVYTARRAAPATPRARETGSRPCGRLPVSACRSDLT